MMLTAVMDAAAAGEQATAAAGHDDLPPASAVSVTTGLNGAPLDAQPSAARIRLPEGAARKVSASVRRACIPGHLRGIGPEPGTWKDPDPRRRSSRGSGGSE